MDLAGTPVKKLLHTYPSANDGGRLWVPSIDFCCRIGSSDHINNPNGSPMSKTAVDLFVQGFQPPPFAPSFDVPPTPDSGSFVGVEVGECTSFDPQASDVEANDTVVLSDQRLPAGMSCFCGPAGNPVGREWLWAPAPADVGGEIVVITATDNNALGAPPHSFNIQITNICDTAPPSTPDFNDDLDGAGNACENCPSDVNPAQSDPDADGVGAVCDDCPVAFNPGQETTDGDNEGGDACDVTLLSPMPGQITCLEPPPTPTCGPCGTGTAFRAQVGWVPTFQGKTKVSSGKRGKLESTDSWLMPNKKWKKACKKSIADLYFRVPGKTKGVKGSVAASETVTITVEIGPRISRPACGPSRGPRRDPCRAVAEPTGASSSCPNSRHPLRSASSVDFEHIDSF